MYCDYVRRRSILHPVNQHRRKRKKRLKKMIDGRRKMIDGRRKLERK